MNSLEVIVKLLDQKKAENLVVLDFEGKNSLADYYVICHGLNDRHVNSLVDECIEKLEENNILIKSVEGDENSGWQLIDTYDVVVHVFSKEARMFYDLENLWLDIKRVDVNEIL